MPRTLLEPFSRALIVESPHASLDTYLRKIGIEPTRLDHVPDEDTLISALNENGAHVLFKRSRVPVSRKVIESCPSLHAIQLCCIGTDSIDLEAAAEHGVLVCNDPVSNGRSVVELAIGHLIAMSRRLYETDVEMHRSEWHKNNKGRYEILDKRLGIVGLGNIGRSVARAAESMGMEVGFFDNRLVAQEVGVEMGWTRYDSLEELFRSSDMVTVHTSAKDYTGKDNAGFLDPWLSSLGKDRSDNSPRLFLNLARGNIHSTQALLDAVESGAVRRAAVDVYPEEPRPGQGTWVNPYEEQPRVVCTPHIGAATQEAQPRIARRVSTTVEAMSLQGSLRDCVFSPRAKMHFGDLAPGHAVLSVVHSVSRGTKKAIDDTIYEAECDNLGSQHRDFDIGVAYDLSVLSRPLSAEVLDRLAQRAVELTQDENAIRAIRQMVVPSR